MLGDKVRELRIGKGLTQQELADELKMSQSAIGMIESNKRKASIDIVNNFAAFFDVTVDYLLGRDDINDESTTINPDIRAIARAGEKLSDEEATTLRKLAETLFPDAFKK